MTAGQYDLAKRMISRRRGGSRRPPLSLRGSAATVAIRIFPAPTGPGGALRRGVTDCHAALRLAMTVRSGAVSWDSGFYFVRNGVAFLGCIPYNREKGGILNGK